MEGTEEFFAGLLTKMGKEFTRDYYETHVYIDDYESVLGGTLPTLYHVADSWGNYDRLAPVLDELSVEYAGRARIVKLDSDENPETTREYGVMSMPTDCSTHAAPFAERLYTLLESGAVQRLATSLPPSVEAIPTDHQVPLERRNSPGPPESPAQPTEGCPTFMVSTFADQSIVLSVAHP